MSSSGRKSFAVTAEPFCFASAGASVASKSPSPNGIRRTARWAYSGTGTKFLRIAFGSVRTRSMHFSSISPGTSQSSRAGSMACRSASATVAVTPSKSWPGSKR